MDEEKMAAAERWLEKAIQLEKEGKSSGLVNKALEKACDLEKQALASK